MNPYVYSPKGIEAYFLPGLDLKCEAGAISTLIRSGAVWNLFWLSTPGIDQVPGAGNEIYKLYYPVKGAAASMTADVMLDDALYSKLCLHPSRFLAWFEAEDHSIYDCYDILGEQVWVDNVIRRATEAASRMAAEVPAIQRNGNVYTATFGSKAA